MFNESFEKSHFRTEKTPKNRRLWEMLISQAKSRFTPYPSLPASRWIKSEYEKQGGMFEERQVNAKDSKSKDRSPKTRDAVKREAAEKKEFSDKKDKK